jgi:16S rRNA (guanine966-N2)-methyltransferase
MRIISGTCRGRKLVPIQGLDIRPTSDRIRESIFNILGHRTRLARVLDLFAGTGALGLEALSRGASHAVFVDRSETACHAIRQNIDRCRFSEQATLIRQDLFVPWSHPAMTSSRFDLIFLDPPYGRDYVTQTLELPGFSDLLSENGIIVAEHDSRETLPPSLGGLDIFREKKYSRTTVSFLTRLQDDV